jgi:hypothetical protein
MRTASAADRPAIIPCEHGRGSSPGILKCLCVRACVCACFSCRITGRYVKEGWWEEGGRERERGVRMACRTRQERKSKEEERSVRSDRAAGNLERRNADAGRGWTAADFVPAESHVCTEVGGTYGSCFILQVLSVGSLAING